MADFTYCVGRQVDKLYKWSAFSNTLLTSVSVQAIDTKPQGMTFDGIHIIWCGEDAAQIYKSSGFSATILDSLAMGGVDTAPHGTSWDGTHILWCGVQKDKNYKNSGFTTTLSDSFSAGNNPTGLGWDGFDTTWCSFSTSLISKNSGFSSTTIDSHDVSGIDTTAIGISWTGSDTIWCGAGNAKLYKQSGWSILLQDSADVSAIDVFPYGITHGDLNQRLRIAAMNFPYIPNVNIGDPIWEPGNIRVQNPLLFMKERQAISDNVVHPAGSRGDSLRINSGGSESFSLRWAGTISGVVIDAVNGANGPGTGIIRSTGNGTLMSWKAPKSDLFGSTVNCSTDGSFVLEDGEDQMKAIRITVYNSYISSNPIQAQVFLEVNYNNAVASDDITAAEASSGDTEWYNFEMENAGSHDMLAVKAWMTQESADNGIWISTDTQRESDEDDTIWSGQTDQKLYQNSAFSSTQKDSIDVSGVDIYPLGITWDETNTQWTGWQAKKLYKSSGFSSSLLNSVTISGVDNDPHGTTYDGTHTYWCGRDVDQLYKSSGFSAVILDSVAIGAVDTLITGITFDGTDYNWSGSQAARLYNMSGFSSTMSDSIAVGAVDIFPESISWTRIDTIWAGNEADKLYKNSAFTSSLIDSIAVTTVDTRPRGIALKNYANRVDTNWYQPTFEDHADALTWSRIAAAGTENLYCRRIIPASSSADIKKEVQLDWAWDGI